MAIQQPTPEFLTKHRKNPTNGSYDHQSLRDHLATRRITLTALATRHRALDLFEYDLGAPSRPASSRSVIAIFTPNFCKFRVSTIFLQMGWHHRLGFVGPDGNEVNSHGWH